MRAISITRFGALLRTLESLLFLPYPGVVPHGGPGGRGALLGRLGELVGRHAHVVQDVGQLPRVDPAVVGHVLLATLVHVRQARCKL